MLWTNPNPKSKFTTQTITIDTSKYSRFLILVNYYDNDTANLKSTEVLNVKDFSQLMYYPMASVTVRTVTVTDNGLNFGTGRYINDGSWKNDDANVVPKFIYGIH